MGLFSKKPITSDTIENEKIQQLEATIAELRKSLAVSERHCTGFMYEARDLREEKHRSDWWKSEYELWAKLVEIGTTYYKNGDREYKK